MNDMSRAKCTPTILSMTAITMNNGLDASMLGGITMLPTAMSGLAMPRAAMLGGTPSASPLHTSEFGAAAGTAAGMAAGFGPSAGMVCGGVASACMASGMGPRLVNGMGLPLMPSSTPAMPAISMPLGLQNLPFGCAGLSPGGFGILPQMSLPVGGTPSPGMYLQMSPLPAGIPAMGAMMYGAMGGVQMSGAMPVGAMPVGAMPVLGASTSSMPLDHPQEVSRPRVWIQMRPEMLPQMPPTVARTQQAVVPRASSGRRVVDGTSVSPLPTLAMPVAKTGWGWQPQSEA